MAYVLDLDSSNDATDSEDEDEEDEEGSSGYEGSFINDSEEESEVQSF